MRHIKKLIPNDRALFYLRGCNPFQFADRVTKLVGDCLDQINEFYNVLSTIEGGGSGNVNSVNGKTGNVVLSAEDVNALPSDTPLFSGDYNDLTNKPTIPAAQIQSDWNQTNNSSKDFIKNKPTIPIVPTNVSAFANDAGYLTQHQDISGKEDVTTIVAPVNETDATQPITTLTCETGVYYRIEVAVDTLAITLPTITDNTTARTCVIALTTDTTPNVTFTAAASSGGTAPDIYVADGFAIEASSTYEVNALWNGTNWYIAGIKLINTASV